MGSRGGSSLSRASGAAPSVPKRSPAPTGLGLRGLGAQRPRGHQGPGPSPGQGDLLSPPCPQDSPGGRLGTRIAARPPPLPRLTHPPLAPSPTPEGEGRRQREVAICKQAPDPRHPGGRGWARGEVGEAPRRAAAGRGQPGGWGLTGTGLPHHRSSPRALPTPRLARQTHHHVALHFSCLNHRLFLHLSLSLQRLLASGRVT